MWVNDLQLIIGPNRMVAGRAEVLLFKPSTASIAKLTPYMKLFITWPHSVTFSLAMYFTATGMPSIFRAPAYTVPKPPLPSISPTVYVLSKSDESTKE